MNSITITTNALLAMSSREVAKLTGKRHDNVMRDIRNMLTTLFGDGGVPSFQHTYIHPQNGQTYPEFHLPKDLTITLIAGYDTALRHRIVTRWMGMEAQSAKAGGVPKTLPSGPRTNGGVPKTLLDALQLAVAEQERIEKHSTEGRSVPRCMHIFG